MAEKYVKIRYTTDSQEFTFVEDFKLSYEAYHSPETRLRTCSATVGYTDDFIYLRSYDTIVCIIDTDSLEAFDILRTEYGYTATSAQHISKFLHDYSIYFNKVFRTDYDRYGKYYQRIR